MTEHRDQHGMTAEDIRAAIAEPSNEPHELPDPQPAADTQG